MTCIIDYIGLKSCSSNPSSGKYINMLPGMGTELMEKIATSEQITGKQVWSDIQSSAYLAFENDIANYLRQNKAVKFDEVILQTSKMDNLGRDQELIEPSNEYRGIYLRLPCSKYTALFLKGIYVYSDSTITTTLKIYDVQDGSEILSQDVELTTGINSVEINQTIIPNYDSLTLFIGIDASLVTTKKTYRNSLEYGDSDCACAFREKFGDCIFEYYPATITIGDEIKFSNIIQQGSGLGFEINADFQCSVEQFICQNLKRLETAWMYCLARQTLDFKKSSPRINLFTTSNLQYTADSIVDYEKKYTNALDRALEVIPNNDFCLSCDDTLKVSYGGSIA